MGQIHAAEQQRHCQDRNGGNFHREQRQDSRTEFPQNDVAVAEFRDQEEVKRAFRFLVRDRTSEVQGSENQHKEGVREHECVTEVD